MDDTTSARWITATLASLDETCTDQPWNDATPEDDSSERTETMGHREVRPVPLDWQHPTEPGTYSDGSPRYRPLYSRADMLSHLEYNADCPLDELIDIDPADYMPEMREGTPYGYQLYETTTEGTPASPVFAALEELAAWCEDGATVFASHKWTRDQWLASFRAESLDTASLMVSDGSGFHPLGGE